MSGLPVTSLYAALLATLYLALSARVILRRRAEGVDMGAGGDRLLERYVRAHGNLAEYAPFGLLLLALVELQGWPRWLVHALGLALLAGRLAHAWAFSTVGMRAPARVAGMTATLVMLGAAAALLLAGALG